MTTVVLPTHNPNLTRFTKTMEGLAAQTAAYGSWELIIVDNASDKPVEPPQDVTLTADVRVIHEPKIGLTHARRAGVNAARGDLIVFVDDDNVLCPSYLDGVRYAFGRLSQVGALGGKSLGQFESYPEPWVQEFFSLLALRDLGDKEFIFIPDTKLGFDEYPTIAPIGAGLAVRHLALERWRQTASEFVSDRVGTALTSGGDNDIVLHVLKSGWGVAYVPVLKLTHLIPSARLKPSYLERLNYGIQKSWMHVLSLHGVNTFSPISRASAQLRKIKAWFTYRAWQNDAARIRWRGACGHFDGRSCS